MYRDPARAIEQGRSVTAVHTAERIVDAVVGRARKDGMTVLDFDQVQPELFDHRRFAATRHHGADLAETIQVGVVAEHCLGS